MPSWPAPGWHAGLVSRGPEVGRWEVFGERKWSYLRGRGDEGFQNLVRQVDVGTK